MNYIKISNCDSANGIGIGCVLWVAGCSHHCPQCHNPKTWDANAGVPFNSNAKSELLETLSHEYINRITFSGGDPLFTLNRNTIATLSQQIKDIYPNKSQWLYTGYSFEDIIKNKEMVNAIKNIDILIDGEFKIDLKDITLSWRGSSNQRVIDVQKSLNNCKIILMETR